MRHFNRLSEKAILGLDLSREEALSILHCPEAKIMDLVAAASEVRHFLFENRVKLNYLVNLKSGQCKEDCSYCSQSLKSNAGILKYSWLKKDEAISAASLGIVHGAQRICLVASGTKPTDQDIKRVVEIITEIKSLKPSIEICACLGFLTEEQSLKLYEAGANAYNHNLNTAKSYYKNICTTHNFEDRMDTIHQVKCAGISACSGFIAGMGETDEELVELIFDLQRLKLESVPVNFLLPFDGTPMQGKNELTPTRCLRILSLVRLVCNRASIRMAAGREKHLRSLQNIGLQIANSIFLGDYLTSEGQEANLDRQLIQDWGFKIEGYHFSQTSHQEYNVVVRKRGVGTTLLPNI